MKKIAIIDPSSYSLSYDFYYIKELLRKGYFIHFYCSETIYNQQYVEILSKEEKIKIYRFGISPSIPGNNKIFGVYAHLKLLVQLMLRRKEYNYIHFFWSIAFFIELPFFLLFRNKLIFTFHNDVPHNFSKKQYFPFKIIFLIAKKIVFISEYVKNSFIQNYNIKKMDNIFNVNIGLLPLFLEELEIAPTQIRKPEEKVVFWGIVDGYKGVDTILLMKKSNLFQDYSFEVYGRWNNDLKSLKKEMIKTGIYVEDKFLTLNELRKLLSRDILFVLPYKKATQSAVVYTLLNYNKVFIASNTGDNADLLRINYLEQLIFDRNDMRSIRKALDYASYNYITLKRKLSKIKEKYKWSNVMKNIHELYDG